MVKTTKAQRKALARLYGRILADWQEQPIGDEPKLVPPTYRDFRKKVQPTIGCDDAVMVPYAGMWVGIETDGLAHS